MRPTLALLGLILTVASDLISPNGTTADATRPTLYWSRPTQHSVLQRKVVWVTAYSSTPDQTDSTPFETASGTTVRRGVVATNILPFGTKIRIPEFFGNEVFVVEDRMHPRKQNNVDIWMRSRRAALNFGRQKTHIEVLG